MKTILVLGATSPIGAALCEQFSEGNRIVLSARNKVRLGMVADKCVKAGAVAIRIAVADLAQTIQPIISANSEWPIDLIVDAASAASGASRIRDPDVSPDSMRGIIQADVLAHLDLYQQLTLLNRKHPDVVFISTVLAIVKTPEREIYSTAKRLIEIYLEKIGSAKSGVRVLIFRIGKLIDPKQDSLKAKAVAVKVQQKLAAGNVTTLYGFGGHILLGLNLLHPKILNLIVKIRRVTRDK
jgi:short-subunit dehydrogenase